jgi:hypothetical protein
MNQLLIALVTRNQSKYPKSIRQGGDRISEDIIKTINRISEKYSSSEVHVRNTELHQVPSVDPLNAVIAMVI